MSKKQPLITSAEDTKLKLTDVLNPDGVLHLTGSNLFFQEDNPDCSCVLQGTRSGQTKECKKNNFPICSTAVKYPVL
nr:hypothetical protein [Candidatus Electrothrix aestuarii]